MSFEFRHILPAGSARIAARIALLYALAGLLWIALSDRLIGMVVADPGVMSRIQTVKGWFFVLVTALFLYWLLRRNLVELGRALGEAHESEHRFRSLFRSTPASIWELDLSALKEEAERLGAREGRALARTLADRPELVRQAVGLVRVLDVNEATLELFGAKGFDELVGALDRVLAPESLPSFADAFVALAEGAATFRTEAAILTLAGERKTVLVTVDFPAERNEFAAVPVCLVDISERQKTDERLSLLESAIEQTSEAITITTAQLDQPGPRIVFVNQAFTRLTGYRPEEVLGKSPRILQGPRTERQELDRLKRELYLRQSSRGRTVNYRKDGSEFIMEWFVTPIMNRQFQVTHFVAVQRDVTEERRSGRETG